MFSLYQFHYLQFFSQKLTFRKYFYMYTFLNTSVKIWFLIPCIQRPILVYEVPIFLVSKLAQKASVYIRKWLKLHKSIASLLFYSSASPSPLTVRSLTSVFKSSKISRHLLLKHSQDASVSSCAPKLQAGIWQVEEAVHTSETDLKHKSIIGHH